MGVGWRVGLRGGCLGGFFRGRREFGGFNSLYSIIGIENL